MEQNKTEATYQDLVDMHQDLDAIKDGIKRLTEAKEKLEETVVVSYEAMERMYMAILASRLPVNQIPEIAHESQLFKATIDALNREFDDSIRERIKRKSMV